MSVVEVTIKFEKLGDGQFAFVNEEENHRRMLKAIAVYGKDGQSVRAWLDGVKRSGETVDCPSCDQEVKVYPRPLNGTMAQILVLIYKYFHKNPGEEWLHVDDFLKQFSINCRYYSIMAYWGLIAAKPGKRGDGLGRTGYWKITGLGVDFVEGRVSVPKEFFMFNKGVYRSMGIDGFSPQQTTLRQALESGGFNYAEMMSKEVFDTAGAA